MASALCRKRLQEIGEVPESEGLRICSAGLFAHDSLTASPEAIAVMQEEGIDISRHRSSRLRAVHVREADLILTMTISQREYIIDKYPEKSENTYTLGEFTGDEIGEVLDPYGQNINAYRRSLAQLKILVDRLINIIIES